MVTKISKTLLFLSLLIILASSPVNAGLYGTSVGLGDLDDSRPMSMLGGDWDGFSISWLISETAPASGIWNYSYTVMNGKDISNFILEFTNPLETSINNFQINGSSGSYEGAQTWTKSGNVNLPNSFYGIKVSTSDLNPVTYSFQTALDPVWGNFHAKDGKDDGADVVAYNAALAISGFNSSDSDDFIVRPNGGGNPPIVPEPISSTLFIVGSAILGFRRLRK